MVGLLRSPQLPFTTRAASREVPGNVGTGGWVATGGQQRPFLDLIPSSSQLSQRRSAPRGWEAGQRESPQGSCLTPPPTPPESRLLLRPRGPAPPNSQAAVGVTIGGPGPGLWAGRAQACPSPAGPAPPRPGARGGRGEAPGSVCASCIRSAAEGGGAEGTQGRGRGWRAVPGAHPRERTLPPLGRNSGRRLAKGLWPERRPPSLL